MSRVLFANRATSQTAKAVDKRKMKPVLVGQWMRIGGSPAAHRRQVLLDQVRIGVGDRLVMIEAYGW